MKKIITILILILGFQVKVSAQTNYESYTLPQLMAEIKNDIPAEAQLYYKELNENQKMHYNGILQSYLDGNLECNYVYTEPRGSLEEMEQQLSDIIKAYKAFLYEHKEFFFIGLHYKPGYKTLEPFHETVEYTLNLAMAEDYYTIFDEEEISNRVIDTEKVKSHFVEILNKRDQIYTYISTLSNDYEKIKYIHDYLILNNEYHKTNSISHTPAGALVDTETPVCEAYSEAFQMLAHHNNLIVAYATGSADNGDKIELHAWNHVKLGTYWYLIDVTWDEGLLEHEVRDNYFLIPRPSNTVRSYDEKSIIPEPFTTEKYGSKPVYTININITEPDGEVREENQYVLSGDDVSFVLLEKEGYDINVTGNYENISNNGSITVTYTIKTFTIRFFNGYELLKSETLEYNETPEAPENPTKEKYVFKGWSPEIKPANANQDYEAVWEFEPTFDNIFDLDNPVMMIIIISAVGVVGLVILTILFKALFKKRWKKLIFAWHQENNQVK